MTPRAWLSVAGLVSLLLVAVVVLRGQGGDGILSVAFDADRDASAGASFFERLGPHDGPVFVTGLENLPASLRGTDVDGELSVDAAGNLVMNAQVRNLFDYFLGTLGEESLPVIVARIRAYLRHALPATAAAQGEAALESYLAYREAMAALPASAPVAADSRELDTAALRAQKEQGKALRARYMDAEMAAAFYADEDAYDSYTLARLDLMRDASLSATEKAARSTALIDTLPPALQESVRAASLYTNLRDLTTDWQLRGGTATELRSIREAAVGAEAADRLEALDEQRAAWQSRVDDYLRARAAILAAPGLAGSEKDRQIADLRAQRFTPEEQLRLGAFESLHDDGA